MAVVWLTFVVPGSSFAFTPQSGPAFQSWDQFMKHYYYSPVMSQSDYNSNFSLEEWVRTQGVAYRLQWDKVLALPEGTDKNYKKRTLELLWNDIMNNAVIAAQQSGRATPDEMKKWLKEGFWAMGFGSQGGDYGAKMKELGLDDPSNFRSFFDFMAKGHNDQPNPVDNVYDCSVDASGGTSSDGLCHSYLEEIDDYGRTIHIVGADTVRSGAWTKPSHWIHSRFQVCKILIEDHTTECRLWNEKNFR